MRHRSGASADERCAGNKASATHRPLINPDEQPPAGLALGPGARGRVVTSGHARLTRDSSGTHQWAHRSLVVSVAPGTNGYSSALVQWVSGTPTETVFQHGWKPTATMMNANDWDLAASPEERQKRTEKGSGVECHPIYPLPMDGPHGRGAACLPSYPHAA